MFCIALSRIWIRIFVSYTKWQKKKTFVRVYICNVFSFFFRKNIKTFVRFILWINGLWRESELCGETESVFIGKPAPRPLSLVVISAYNRALYIYACFMYSTWLIYVNSRYEAIVSQCFHSNWKYHPTFLFARRCNTKKTFTFSSTLNQQTSKLVE